MLAKLASSSSSAVVPNDKSAGQKCHKDCKHTLPCGHLICNECLDSIISPRYARRQGVAYTGICADKECQMAFKSTIVRGWNGERYECGSSIGEPKPSRPPLTFPTAAKPIPAKTPATPKQPKQVLADPETPDNLEDDDLPLGPDELLFSSRSYRAAEEKRLLEEGKENAEPNATEKDITLSEPGSGHTTPRLQPSESLGLGILHISGGAMSSNSPMSRARATSISGSPSKRARLRHRRVNPPASLDTIPPVVPLPGPSKSLKRARSSSSHASVEPESKPRKRRGYGIRPLERESSFDMPNSSQAKNEAYAGIWQRESAALHVPDRERGDSEDDGEYSIQSSSQRTIFRSSQSSV